MKTLKFLMVAAAAVPALTGTAFADTGLTARAAVDDGVDDRRR